MQPRPIRSAMTLGRRRRSLRIGAFTTIAAIAADRAHRRGLSGHRCRRTRSRHAADPSSRHARRQPRAAFALLVFSQSAYRLPQEGRQRLPGTVGQSSLSASPSISAPAWRRIPPPWRRRCSPMTPKSTTDQRSGLTIGDTPGRRLQRHRRSRAAAGRDDPQHRTACAACRASARSTSAPSAAAMPNGRWSKSAPAPWSRTARSSSSASPPAASRRCRCALRRARPRCRASRPMRQRSPKPQDKRHQAQSRCR